MQERHFNDLQTSYRNMASGWLLATFAAIGFVISQNIRVAVDPEFLIAVIAIAGWMGITLLWILDLLVYHRLLDSCFVEGLILEERYPWVPPFRHNMMNTQKGLGVLFRTVGFYLVPIVLLILIAGGALSLWLYRAGHPFSALLLVTISVVLAFLSAIVIRSKTENTIVIQNRLTEGRTNR